MAKSEWAKEMEDRSAWPACPNKVSHGELTPHAAGGLVCVECEEEHAGTRSRESHRWANPR
jgi:hypothetical protein